MTSTRTPPARPAEETAVVRAACLVTTLVPLGSTSVAVALPRIGAALDAGVAGVVTLVTAYLVVTASCQPVAGALGDRWGRRRSVVLGVAGSGAAALLATAVPLLVWVVALRCVQAACGALALVNAAALVRTAVPDRRRGRALGAVGAAATLAAAAGPALGGAAVHLIGWRGAFLVGVPVAVAALLAAVRALPADPPRHPRTGRFDVSGTVLLTVLLGGTATLLSLGGGLPAAVVAAAVAALLAVAAAFARWELRCPVPVLDVRVLRLRGVVAAGAAVATGNLALYTVVLAVPLLVGSGAAVVLLLPLLLGASAGALTGGRLSDRWGRRAPAVLGGALVTAPAAALVAVDPVAHRPAAAVLLAVCGIGQGVAGAAVQAAGLEALPPERAGLASGVWSTCRYLGSITGASLLALLVSGGTGQGVFALAAVGGALSVAAAAALPRRSAQRGEGDRRGRGDAE
ncbi:MFS transporter [Blastococcus sp. SYSU D00813]